MAERLDRIGGVVLAAGAGRRFGRDKLLAVLSGRELVSHVLETASAARRRGLLASTHVVVAGGDTTVASLARSAGAAVVINPDPARGLSSSLALGLSALNQDLEAALVMLGDQPLVRLDVIAALVSAWHEGVGPVIRPRYAGAPEAPGHPVLIGRGLWPLASELEGDRGFGPRFAPGAPGVTSLDVPGVNPDVDTPADLLALRDPSR